MSTGQIETVPDKSLLTVSAPEELAFARHRVQPPVTDLTAFLSFYVDYIRFLLMIGNGGLEYGQEFPETELGPEL